MILERACASRKVSPRSTALFVWGKGGRIGFDRETNLNYNGARDYDPATGRYPSADPLGLAGGDLSLYLYAKNNPLSHIDPLGLCDPGDVTCRIAMRSAGIPGYAPPTPPQPNNSGFNKQQCVQNYLNQYYGSFVANTLVPNFSLLSYVPGSGTSSQAWTSSAVSLASKGALVGAPYVAGQAMNLSAIAQATGAQMTMQSLAPAATPGNALITASKVASRGFGLAAAATVPFSTAANAMALLNCSCSF